LANSSGGRTPDDLRLLKPTELKLHQNILSETSYVCSLV